MFKIYDTYFKKYDTYINVSVFLPVIMLLIVLEMKLNSLTCHGKFCQHRRLLQ